MSHFWFVVPWLHILAMAFFVGGQLFSPRSSCQWSATHPIVNDLRMIARRFSYSITRGTPQPGAPRVCAVPPLALPAAN